MDSNIDFILHLLKCRVILFSDGGQSLLSWSLVAEGKRNLLSDDLHTPMSRLKLELLVENTYAFFMFLKNKHLLVGIFQVIMLEICSSEVM